MKTKWIDYAIEVIRSIFTGSASIKEIAEDIEGPEAYVAKVIAKLRKAGLIDDNYDLVKAPEQITVREVIEASNLNQPEGEISKRIQELMFSALEISIINVW